MITSALSSMASFAAQQQEYAAAKKRYEQNAENARRGAINQYSAIQLKAIQQGALSNQKGFQANIDNAKAAATATTAAGEGGVQGNSVGQLMSSLFAQGGRYDAALMRNLGTTDDAASAAMEAAEIGGQGNINRVPIPTAPSPLGMITDLFGSAVGYADQRQKAASGLAY